MNIIEKLEITPGKDGWDEAKCKMLEALIGWCLYWDRHFEPSKRFEQSIFIIEKATGKTWEEIKELINA